MNTSNNNTDQFCFTRWGIGAPVEHRSSLEGAPQISTVLIVDDDPVSSYILSTVCSHLHAESVLVSDGELALELLEKRPPELVMLDRSMPTIDGFEVLRKIRTQFSTAELPVVMVTADDDSESVVEAFENGANDYIAKPFDSATAMARIKTHLQLQQIQRQLSESKQRYALAMRGTNDGMWDWDFQAGRVYFSPRWQAMLGFEEEELFGPPQHWFSRIHEDDRQRVHDALEAHLAFESPCFDTELRMQHTSEEYRWMLCRGKAVFDSRGNAIRMAGSLTDVTEGKSADALTGLANRVLFTKRVTRRLEQYYRDQSRSFAVIYIDLDDFKQINDTHGHDAGDELLVRLAHSIDQSVRGPNSVAARLGGDEFAVLIENLADESAGEVVVQRLARAICGSVTIQQRHIVRPSASIGIAFPHPGVESAEEMIRTADLAMYQAKKQGKEDLSTNA